MCDWYFAPSEFRPENQDAAVHRVRSDPDLEYFQRKELILCWFDHVYGRWNGSRYDLNDSREQMSKFLKQSGFATYEAMFDYDAAAARDNMAGT